MDYMRAEGDPVLGHKLQVAREAKKLTRREVGEALGLSDQYVYQVESGRRMPTLETLWNLAVHLEVNPNELDQRLASKPGKRKRGE